MVGTANHNSLCCIAGWWTCGSCVSGCMARRHPQNLASRSWQRPHPGPFDRQRLWSRCRSAYDKQEVHVRSLHLHLQGSPRGNAYSDTRRTLLNHLVQGGRLYRAPIRLQRRPTAQGGGGLSSRSGSTAGSQQTRSSRRAAARLACERSAAGAGGARGSHSVCGTGGHVGRLRHTECQSGGRAGGAITSSIHAVAQASRLERGAVKRWCCTIYNAWLEALSFLEPLTFINCAR